MKFEWDEMFVVCTNDDIWDAIERVRKSKAKKPPEERITLEMNGVERISITIRRES